MDASHCGRGPRRCVIRRTSRSAGQGQIVIWELKTFSYISLLNPKIIIKVFSRVLSYLTQPLPNCPVHVEQDPGRSQASPLFITTTHIRSDYCIFFRPKAKRDFDSLGHVLNDAITQKSKCTRFKDDIIQ
jgi:hypothetical protein